MIKESKAMKEVHEIMERIYESQKGMSPEEIVKDFNKSSEEFIKKHNLKLRRAEDKETAKV